MKSTIYRDADYALSHLAQVSCHSCDWFGNEDELNLVGNHWDCPECEAHGEDLNRDDTPNQDVDIQEFLNELLLATIEFNRKFGYKTYRDGSDDIRKYNVRFEIDLHGYLIFEVLNWEKFNQQNSGCADYYDVQCDGMDVNNPEHFDVAKMRDAITGFAKICNKLDGAS